MAVVRYRGYRIHFDPPPIPTRECDWHFAHEDYDEGDRRHGSAPSEAACKAEIDEIEGPPTLADALAEIEFLRLALDGHRIEHKIIADQFSGAAEPILQWASKQAASGVERAAQTLAQSREDFPFEGRQMAPDDDSVLDALRLILPLAKGYAAAHRVGSNAAYVAAAEELVARVEGRS